MWPYPIDKPALARNQRVAVPARRGFLGPGPRPNAGAYTETVADSSAILSAPEVTRIVRAILPRFEEYVVRYEERKYWPEVYACVRQGFGCPRDVPNDTLRDALLWKYGHLGKPAIPAAHERLILEVQRHWRTVVAELPLDAEATFRVLQKTIGGDTRFITVAFLLHLLRPTEVPIIDRHNFRAVNGFIAGSRPGWLARKKPSRYQDIILVSGFMRAVLPALNGQNPEQNYTERDLDKFLMMYGKFNGR